MRTRSAASCDAQDIIPQHQRSGSSSQLFLFRHRIQLLLSYLSSAIAFALNSSSPVITQMAEDEALISLEANSGTFPPPLVSIITGRSSPTTGLAASNFASLMEMMREALGVHPAQSLTVPPPAAIDRDSPKPFLRQRQPLAVTASSVQGHWPSVLGGVSRPRNAGSNGNQLHEESMLQQMSLN